MSRSKEGGGGGKLDANDVRVDNIPRGRARI